MKLSRRSILSLSVPLSASLASVQPRITRWGANSAVGPVCHFLGVFSEVDSMEFIAASIPSLPVVGNHELEKPAGTPKSLALPAIWKLEFAYPQNGPDLPENESYRFDYQGVRFLSLNVNILENEKDFDANRPIIEQMVAWVDKALTNNPNRWTIVTQHQGMYSMAEKRNYVKMREMLLPTYEKHGVDLVLQGHDHLYARSQKIAGGKVVAADATGIVYMISVSGPKMYEVTPTFEPLMAKVITHTQMFQTVDVDQNKLVLRAYSSEGEQLDGFQLEKKGRPQRLFGGYKIRGGGRRVVVQSRGGPTIFGRYRPGGPGS
jgi:hypothetical protein